MYPVRYEADYVEEPRNRATTFFRLLLAIPWLIVAQIYAIAAFVVAFIAWFAILFTGRYPEGLYNFQAGFLRFTARVNGWFFLQTDEWPSFGFGDDPAYPIRLQVDAPPESYNRWKTAFRLILAFPVYVMAYLIPYLAQIGAVVAWLHIVFLGRTSGGIHNAISTGVAWQVRAGAYLMLVTETIPPVSDQAPAATQKPGRAIAPPKKAAAKKAAAKKPATKKAAAKKSAPRKR